MSNMDEEFLRFKIYAALLFGVPLRITAANEKHAEQAFITAKSILEEMERDQYGRTSNAGAGTIPE